MLMKRSPNFGFWHIADVQRLPGKGPLPDKPGSI
jgi:hypothetical protein